MGKSFYHFLMKYRGGSGRLAEFAAGAFRDHGFPKESDDYDEISRYLELNGDYLPTMAVFDEAFELYRQLEKNK